jgi:hypothetical protein
MITIVHFLYGSCLLSKSSLYTEVWMHSDSKIVSLLSITRVMCPLSNGCVNLACETLLQMPAIAVQYIQCILRVLNHFMGRNGH